MSKSIHITRKNFRGLTKRELDEQFNDDYSDLSLWAKKKGIKKLVKKSRRKGILCITFLVVNIFFLVSCSSLRTCNDNKDRVVLNASNFRLIEGKYRVNAINNKGSFDLLGCIFAGGYKFFKYTDNCQDSSCYVQFEVLDKNTLRLSYLTTSQKIKSTKIKGKLKNGYFVMKQSHLFLSIIFTNLYRNRQFRMGLLNNGDLITDHNQISLGTAMVIIPFYDNEKNCNVEYKRIE